jgi:hypothetical protein
MLVGAVLLMIAMRQIAEMKQLPQGIERPDMKRKADRFTTLGTKVLLWTVPLFLILVVSAFIAGGMTDGHIASMEAIRAFGGCSGDEWCAVSVMESVQGIHFWSTMSTVCWISAVVVFL